MIPPPSLDVVICHPELPSELRDAIEKYNDDNVGLPEPHIVIQRVPNFEGMGYEEKAHVMWELIKFLNATHQDTAVSTLDSVLVLSPSHMINGSVIAKRIIEYLKTMRGLSLAYLLCQDIPHQIKGEAWDKNHYAPYHA